MNRRRTATEITIQTDQVLVVHRRQVTHSCRGDLADKDEFVSPGQVSLRQDNPTDKVSPGGISNGSVLTRVMATLDRLFRSD